MVRVPPCVPDFVIAENSTVTPVSADVNVAPATTTLRFRDVILDTARYVIVGLYLLRKLLRCKHVVTR